MLVGGWLPDEGWRSVDGMLPVNTAGSPGGGLQWPSGGDLVDSAEVVDAIGVEWWSMVADAVDDDGSSGQRLQVAGLCTGTFWSALPLRVLELTVAPRVSF